MLGGSDDMVWVPMDPIKPCHLSSKIPVCFRMCILTDESERTKQKFIKFFLGVDSMEDIKESAEKFFGERLKKAHTAVMQTGDVKGVRHLAQKWFAAEQAIQYLLAKGFLPTRYKVATSGPMDGYSISLREGNQAATDAAKAAFAAEEEYWRGYRSVFPPKYDRFDPSNFVR